MLRRAGRYRNGCHRGAAAEEPVREPERDGNAEEREGIVARGVCRRSRAGERTMARQVRAAGGPADR